MYTQLQTQTALPLTFPWFPATAAIVPLAGQPLPAATQTCLYALAARILAAPLGKFEPVERCGRIVTVALEPSAAIDYYPDPVLPIPLVALPDKFWNRYAAFVADVADFLAVAESRSFDPREKARMLQKATRRLWKQADRLAKMAAVSLRAPEVAYLKARLLAALAGEMAATYRTGNARETTWSG